MDDPRDPTKNPDKLTPPAWLACRWQTPLAGGPHRARRSRDGSPRGHSRTCTNLPYYHVMTITFPNTGDTPRGSLACVGLGMTLGSHLTPLARSHIEQADVVFAALSDGIVEMWLEQMHPDVRSLQPYYARGQVAHADLSRMGRGR